MDQSLLLVLLLALLAGTMVLRVVVRVRSARRMRSKPRPDHLPLAAPVLLGVIVVALIVLTAADSPASALPAVLGIGAAIAIVLIAALVLTNRDLRQRAGDSWSVRRITPDGVVALVLYAAGAVGIGLLRIPQHDSERGADWWAPLASVVLLLAGNGAAYLWRRTHLSTTTTAAR